MATKEAPRSEWEPDPEAPEVMVIDRSARRGASLRSQAREDGATTVIRRENRQLTRRFATEVGVVAALLLSGISLISSDHNRSVKLGPGPTEVTEPSPETTAPEPTISPNDPRLIQWFLNYTGNPAGPTSGAPVKFGAMMPTFTYRNALDAAATYLNEVAGGVGGRPIEMDICQQTPTDCAHQFAADPAVIAVLQNEWSDDSLGVALAGRKPLHATYSGSGTLGVEYYPSYLETVTAMARLAEMLTPPGGRVLVIDAAVDQGQIVATPTPWKALPLPDLASIVAKREVVTVTASHDEVLATTIRRSGASDAQTIVLAAPPFDLQVLPSGETPCEALSDALAELDIQPTVITSECEPHEGWYKLDVGFNVTSPDLQSGALSITTKMPPLGGGLSEPEERQYREIGALLAVIRLINQVGGPAQATPTVLDRAMRDFTGPLPLGAGPLDCSPTGRVAQHVLPGSCVRFVDVHRFVDGNWIDLPPIDLGS